MYYKSKDDAVRMAEYYTAKASKEADKYCIVEKAIRDRIIEILNGQMLSKTVIDSIKDKLEIVEEIIENLYNYKKCRDEANDEAKKYECEEEEKQ